MGCPSTTGGVTSPHQIARPSRTTLPLEPRSSPRRSAARCTLSRYLAKRGLRQTPRQRKFAKFASLNPKRTAAVRAASHLSEVRDNSGHGCGPYFAGLGHIVCLHVIELLPMAAYLMCIVFSCMELPLVHRSLNLIGSLRAFKSTSIYTACDCCQCPHLRKR